MDVLYLYRNKTFTGVLNIFENHLNHLVQDAQALSAQMHVCQTKVVGSCSFKDELEHNGDGNLRPAFAKLYTRWAKFHQFFLASSLVSTEAYYMQEQFGSLLDEQLAVSAAA